MDRALKTVTYRGGLVRFRIPAEWVENQEPEGGGEFFADGPDTPTLRLNVLTFRVPTEPREAAKVALSGSGGPIVRLANGCDLVCSTRTGEEAGETLHITTWEIAQAVPPDTVRLLIFSWTILAEREGDPEFALDLELIDREIRAAVLG